MYIFLTISVICFSLLYVTPAPAQYPKRINTKTTSSLGEISIITNEMVGYFHTRTNQHIARVRNNMLAMVDYHDLELETLQARADLHDHSKLLEPESNGYIWLTWYHRCKNNGTDFSYPPEVENIVKEACHHHLHSNSHHPESYGDVEQMTILDIVEMVSDWTAMSQEYGQGSCLDYVLAHIDQWGFSDEKKQLIFATIAELDRRINNLDSSNMENAL